METAYLRYVDKFCELVVNAYRAASRAASAVRSGEGLVEIEVHYVEAHIARTHGAQQRVHIGSVIVEEASAAVYKFCNLRYFALEESERVRIGHHNAGYFRSEEWFEGLYIDQPVLL